MQKQRRGGETGASPFDCAIRESQSIRTSTIMTAQKKPAGVSSVRWRIELRRRAAKDLYDNKFCPAPDPDLLPAAPLG